MDWVRIAAGDVPWRGAAGQRGREADFHRVEAQLRVLFPASLARCRAAPPSATPSRDTPRTPLELPRRDGSLPRMFCSRCGSEITGKSKFCPSCGLDLMATTPVHAIATGALQETGPRARVARGRVRDHRGAGPGRHGHGLPGQGPPAGARSGDQGAAVLPGLRHRVRRAVPARGPHRGPARAPQHHPDLPGRPVRPGHLLRHEVPAGRLALHRAGRAQEAHARRRSAGCCSRPAARWATPRSAASSTATSSPTTSCSTSSGSAC